jgi:hypothetical protein
MDSSPVETPSLVPPPPPPTSTSASSTTTTREPVVNPPPILILAPEHHVRAVATLIRSFEADPIFNYMLRSHPHRARAFATFFSFVIEAQYQPHASTHPLGHSHMLADASAIAMWQPPGVTQGLPFPMMVRMLGIAPIMFGWLGIWRALRLGLRVDTLHPSASKRKTTTSTTSKSQQLSDQDASAAQAMVGRPHFYLGVVAVDPAHQGKGLARRVMSPILQRADEEGMPCYLENSNIAKNTVVYKKLGFRELKTVKVGPEKDAPSIMSMWREPQKQKA